MSTVRDIASLAKVSIATVSRALNQPEKLQPETLELVEAAMKDLNYERKVAVKKRTNLFGIIFPNISNPFFSELLEVIENEAFHHGRCVLFFNSRHNLRQEQLCLQECENHGVDGVFWVPHCMEDDYLKKVKDYKFKTVVLTQTTKLLPSIAVDHAEGGRLAATHLASLGINNIGYVGPITKSEEKLHGFSESLEQLKVKLKPEFMFNTEVGNDIREFISSLIDGDEVKVKAIFCINDVYAQKVIEEFIGLNIKVPNDIVIIGFDNSLTAKILNISSISQPMREIAHVGFETMISLLKSNEKHKMYTPQLLLPRLVLRGSSIQVK